MAVRVSKVVIPIPTWIDNYKTFFEFLNFILKKSTRPGTDSAGTKRESQAMMTKTVEGM